MKLAIKVLTEWDRLNVIPFFEKNFPECNKSGYMTKEVEIGEFWMLEYVKKWDSYVLTFNFDEDLSDYTILQGVPQNMELPKVEENRVGHWQVIKSREQELEECLLDYITLSSLYGSTTESNYTIQLDTLTDKAKQLLNK